MKIKKYIFLMPFLLSSIVAFGGNLPSVTLADGHVDVTTPSGRRQIISGKNMSPESGVKFIDLTFNGYADLLILRDKGASQEFYDVYLYSRGVDEYVYNRRLSNIPCLSVDSARKELVGQCFHESACENWEEHYSVSRKGAISLVERKGTYCDPAGGQGYIYIDRFRNGRRISSESFPVENK